MLSQAAVEHGLLRNSENSQALHELQDVCPQICEPVQAKRVLKCSGDRAAGCGSFEVKTCPVQGHLF